MIELWNLSQNIRYHTKSGQSKYEAAMKKYSKSSRLKSFKQNVRDLRQKSDMLDN
jgi:hypothetical protein